MHDLYSFLIIISYSIVINHCFFLRFDCILNINSYNDSYSFLTIVSYSVVINHCIFSDWTNNSILMGEKPYI